MLIHTKIPLALPAQKWNWFATSWNSTTYISFPVGKVFRNLRQAAIQVCNSSHCDLAHHKAHNSKTLGDRPLDSCTIQCRWECSICMIITWCYPAVLLDQVVSPARSSQHQQTQLYARYWLHSSRKTPLLHCFLSVFSPLCKSGKRRRGVTDESKFNGQRG